MSGLNPDDVLRVLGGPQSVHDLRRYFGVDLPNGLPAFTGGRFERLGGGGDQPASKDVITADDLLAVEMLSVQVPPRVALDLLEGDLGRVVATELRSIPTDISLADEGAAQYIADGGPADRAWRLLKNNGGVGWVTAGKLLARKRPRLVPVYDEVVRCAYRSGRGFWNCLHKRLREDGDNLANRLSDLHAEAGLPQEITILRVLDVVFWMRHRDGHTGYRCRGIVD
ncbi:DUF6308 family protein [Micromonospora chersina]|uniref:DUF6308 family protein n=1 Tax=Micromonospora chersina TaxID=47854 RepID=UPI003407B604